ncbi:MAG: hypothetical protein IPM34_11660 [Saprospiraceae bacterium]|nr:hypothetical protein [Saprospiraceae bacterium]
MQKYIFICITCLLCSQCKPGLTIVNPKPIQIDWIVGIWKHKDKELYEKWIRKSETEYIGIAYDLDMGFATVRENMRIFRQGNDSWFFEAKVKENDFKPVLFKWMPDPVIDLKFVNETHDFPNIVMYKREAFDIMTGSVSNLNGDKIVHSDYTRFAVK